MQEPFAEDPGVRWMLAYQRGSEQAFDELVRAYSGQVFALFTRFLGTVPEREDLVQEVFLRVIRSRERYEPTARFSTWLYRIAFNLAVNRTERAPAELSLEAGRPAGPGTSLARSPAHSPEGGLAAGVWDPRGEAPSDALERGDVVQAVRAAIASLPPSQRMALVLAKYHEMPYAEVAEVLGSSEKAIKSMIHRAREALRARLAPFLEETLP